MDEWTRNLTAYDLDSPLPVYGLPGMAFYIIHNVAIVSCSISIICSSSVIIFLFLTERRTTKRNFYRWTTGERLVVYLAVFDLGFSISHTMDHAYIYAAFEHPPDSICRFFAFLIVQNILGQGLTVLFTAVSALILVLFQYKMRLGRRDWKLLLYSVGLPFLFCFFGVIYSYIGASGPWCIMEARNKLGKIMNNVKAAVMLTVFFGSGLSYFIIWGKMRSSGPQPSTPADLERRQRYHRSARVMLLFVIAYVLQWWTWVAHAIWGFVGEPDAWLVVLVVFLCNMGGVFNGFAYTVMRRKYLKDSKKGMTTRTQTQSNQPSLESQQQPPEQQKY